MLLKKKDSTTKQTTPFEYITKVSESEKSPPSKMESAAVEVIPLESQSSDSDEGEGLDYEPDEGKVILLKKQQEDH